MLCVNGKTVDNSTTRLVGKGVDTGLRLERFGGAQWTAPLLFFFLYPFPL